MSLKKQALTGVFWTSLQQFSSQGIAFVVSIVLARLLMPAEFGLIAMIGVFIGLGNALADNGLSQSLIRTDNPSQKDYSTVFYFNLLGSFFIYWILFFCAPFIAGFFNQTILTDILRWYALVIIINAFGTIQMTRLTKHMHFKTQMKITIPSLLLGSVTGIILALLGYGVWSLVVSALVQAFALSLQLWLRNEWRPSWVFDRTAFKFHFHYGYKLTLSGILDRLFTNAYTIIIGKFFAPALVGFYNRADTLKQFPVTNIGTILNKVTFPLFAQIKNDDVRLKQVYQRLMKLVVYLVAPLLLVASVLAEPLFRFLFTEKWLPAVPYFQILCWNGILYPIHSYNLNILKVKGRSDLFLKLEVLKKIMIACIIAASFPFGIYGLLYGSVISSLLAFFINTHYTGKFLNYTTWQQTKDLLPLILLSVVVAGVTYVLFQLVQTHVTTHDLILLLLCGTFAGFLYLMLSYFLKISSFYELLHIIQKK